MKKLFELPEVNVITFVTESILDDTPGVSTEYD